MIVTSTTTDSIGKIRKYVTLSNGDTIVWKFSSEPSTALLNQMETQYLAQHQYDYVQTEIISIYDNIEAIRDFILKVKATPTVTLAQYNTYLGLKPWYEQAVIRYFVYKLATGLANKKGITLNNLTETTVLQALRDWVVATNGEVIKRVIGNGLNL